MSTYRAITVVTGLTTVYCRTPSLHLKSSTLTEKERNAQTSAQLPIHPTLDPRPLTLPWATAGSSTAAAGAAAAAGPPASAPGWGTGCWGSSAERPGSCRWRRPRSTLCTCPRRWPGWGTVARATGQKGKWLSFKVMSCDTGPLPPTNACCYSNIM